jgi:hypothetical protein
MMVWTQIKQIQGVMIEPHIKRVAKLIHKLNKQMINHGSIKNS